MFYVVDCLEASCGGGVQLGVGEAGLVGRGDGVLRQVVGEVLLRVIVLTDHDVVVVVFYRAVLLQYVLRHRVQQTLVPFHIHLDLLVDPNLFIHLLSDYLIDLSVVVMQQQ